MTLNPYMLVREAAGVLGCALVFTLTGAYNTRIEFTFLQAFFYWTANIAVCASCFHLSMHFALRGGLFTLWERALRIALACLPATIPAAAFILLMENLTRPGGASPIWNILVGVYAIGTLICLVRFMPTGWTVQKIDEKRTVEPQRVPFLQRPPD